MTEPKAESLLGFTRFTSHDHGVGKFAGSTHPLGHRLPGDFDRGRRLAERAAFPQLEKIILPPGQNPWGETTLDLAFHLLRTRPGVGQKTSLI